MSEQYKAALEVSAEAIKAFGVSQKRYRAQEIGDAEFLAARAVYDAAMAEYDVAFAKEQAGEPMTQDEFERLEHAEDNIRASEPKNAALSQQFKEMARLSRERVKLLLAMNVHEVYVPDLQTALLAEPKMTDVQAGEVERQSAIRAELRSLGVVDVEAVYREVEDVFVHEDGRLVSRMTSRPMKQVLAEYVENHPELRPDTSELLAALAALKSAVKIADEAFEAWDNDNDMRVGKILRALAGQLKGYRADIDAIHAAIAKAEGR